MSGIMSFSLYAITGIVIIFIGMFLFKVSTPQKEDELIKGGNIAASIVLNGKVFGLAIVVAAAIYNSINYIDMLAWSGVGLVSQIIVYKAYELLVKFTHRKTGDTSFQEEIEQDNRAFSIKIATVSIVVGMIISASMTY